jgi:hypothetical protein
VNDVTATEEQTVRKIYQIVPRLPPLIDGVGDYSLQIARTLRKSYDIDSKFIVGDPYWQGSTEIEGFLVEKVYERSTLALMNLLATNDSPDTALLHYVGYGYHPRGIPFWLLNGLKLWQRTHPHSSYRLLTMFHELYAFGPPWKSEFWLRPFQVKIAKKLMQYSETCFASNYIIKQEIQQHKPLAVIKIHPVASNFGEPKTSSLELYRVPSRWIICGGTGLITRSLQSLIYLISKIPSEYYPAHLDVIGGYKSKKITILLEQCTNFSTAYYPQISPLSASKILAEASFAWLDYFGSGKVWPSMILKSTAFAACSAHGVITVFSHNETRAVIDGEFHPGVFYLNTQGLRLPEMNQLSNIRQKIFDWYQRHSSSEVIARAYAKVLMSQA